MRRMRQTRNNRVTPRGNGKEGLSISGNADFGNGLGLGVENGRNGTTGSLTILGSQQGTVDQNGNYEANANFLSEINGQDIVGLADTVERRRLAEENERNPAKDAKNAKDAADAKEARDDDAKEVGDEDGPSGLVDLAFAGLGVVMSAGAAFLAGGGSGSSSPTAPAGGQSGAGNGGNANTSQATFAGRKEDEKDGKVKGDGDTKDEPPIKPDKIKAGTDRVADLLDSGEDLAKHGIKTLVDDGGTYYRLADGTEVRATHVNSERNLRANQSVTNGVNVQNASMNDSVSLSATLLSGVVFDQEARDKGIRSPELIAAENYPSDRAEQFKDGIAKLDAQLDEVKNKIREKKEALADPDPDIIDNVSPKEYSDRLKKELNDWLKNEENSIEKNEEISKIENDNEDFED